MPGSQQIIEAYVGPVMSVARDTRNSLDPTMATELHAFQRTFRPVPDQSSYQGHCTSNCWQSVGDQVRPEFQWEAAAPMPERGDLRTSLKAGTGGRFRNLRTVQYSTSLRPHSAARLNSLAVHSPGANNPSLATETSLHSPSLRCKLSLPSCVQKIGIDHQVRLGGDSRLLCRT